LKGIGQIRIQNRNFDALYVNQLAKYLFKSWFVIMQILGVFVQLNENDAVFTGA